MASTVEQFFENLAQSRLLTDVEAEAFVDALPAERRPADGEALAKELVRAGRLTRYQAAMVLHGKGRRLVLGDYVVLDKLGEGGMGQVFKAEHQRMKRIVALKVLPPSVMRNREAVLRFQREMEAAAKLTHPNIVIAHDAREDDGVHYLVMEFVEGSDLGALVRKRGVLSVPQAVACILQVASGLAHAHAQGIIHRDIKPSNLLLDKDGVVKILDMGLARIVQETATAEQGKNHNLTNTGMVMGTVDYMSPEQAINTRHADARSDIYSLGCTLFFLLTGRCMYEGETIVQRIMAHCDDPIPSLCDARSDVPPELNAVYHGMVAKRPEDRYQTMTEVMVALDGALSGTPSGVSKTPSAPGSAPVQRAPGDDFKSDLLSALINLGPGAARALVNDPSDQNWNPGDHSRHHSRLPLRAGETAAARTDSTINRQGDRATPVYASLAAGLKIKPMVWIAALAALAVAAVLWGVHLPHRSTDHEDSVIGPGGDADVSGKSLPVGKALPKGAMLAEGTTPGQEWSDNNLGIKFCWCPPGQFTMGSPKDDPGRSRKQQPDQQWHLPDQVRVTLSGFWLGKYEVTQEEWRAVIGTTLRQQRDKTLQRDKAFKKKTIEQSGEGPRFPMHYVSYDEATDFCRILSEQERQKGRLPPDWEYRLPTEAQWEYACRTGGTGRFTFGDDESLLEDYAWFEKNSGGVSHEVGGKRPNAWGLHDMHGNVIEWCRDALAKQLPGGLDPLVTEPDDARIKRGGGWSALAADLASAYRKANAPNIRQVFEGFRVALVSLRPGPAKLEPKSMPEVKSPAVSLFDRRSLQGWRGLKSEKLPADWRVEDDSIVGPGNKTYLATVDAYGDYELELQWKISRGANAGVFYRWAGELRVPNAGLGDLLAPEYQIVDNANHPNGKKPETATGSVFSLLAPTKDASKPAGEWNVTRLVVRGPHVEHWLNGEKILAYDVGSADWNRRIAAHPQLSKEPAFGRPVRGRIVLQSYTGQVWYRDIRLKTID